MDCDIEWNSLSLAAWQERFARLRRANMLQSYEYAQALCPLQGQKARWGLIKIDGREAGLVQLLEAGLCRNLLHAVILDRGPLWFDGFGAAADVEAFFALFDRLYPRRFGRRRRIIPEAVHPLDAVRYKRLSAPGYQTVWLDLTPEKETLRKNLKSSWRNKLNKAENAGLETVWDADASFFPALLRNYLQDKATKGYDGPSIKLLQALKQSFGRNMLIGRAVMKGQTVAAVMLLCHGQSATYQLGWCLPAGRSVAAHNALLWETVLELKARGMRDFDLGGINDEGAKTVGDFKKAMGGAVVTLSGHYT